MRSRFGVLILLSFLLLAALSISIWLFSSGEKGVDLLSAEERAWLEAHPGIRLAPDPNFPPIEYFDENGRYAGLMAEIFAEIEKNLGYEFTYVQLDSWNDVLRAAEAREVDGITAAQMTPERSRYLLFSEPILDIPNVIIVRTDMTGEFTFASMSGMHVAVTQGNALHEYIQVQYPHIILIPVSDDLAALKEVSFGRADATVVNLAIASYLIEKHGITNLRVAGDSGKNNSLYIATRSDQPILNQIMQKGLSSVSENERQSIYRRWISLGGQNFWETRLFWGVIAVGLILLALVIAISFFWTASLREQVKIRTQELAQELAERKKTEEALQESETRFRALFETAGDAILLLDEDVFIDCNPQALVLFHCKDKNELIGYTPMDFSAELQPDGIPSKEKAQQRIQAAKEGIPQRFYWQHQCRDGTIFDAEVSLNALTLGGKTYCQAIGRDITLQLRAEKELQQSRERLELALRGADLGTFDWDVVTGESHYDERWASMLGYTLDEIEPHFSAWERLMHPDDLAEAQERARIVLSGEKDFYESEQRMRHKSGRYIWVLARSRVIEWDKEGNPRRVSGIHMDITQRKEAEEALQKSEERFRLAMDATHEGLYDINFVTGEIYFSPGYYRMLGYEPGEFTDTEEFYLNQIHPDDRERVQKLNEDFRENRSSILEGEFRLRTKNGEWRWVLGRGRAIERDENGKVVRAVGTRIDITQLKQREREFEVIAAVSSALRSAETREQILSIILEQTIQLLDADAGELELIDPLTGDAVVVMATGGFEVLMGARTPIDQGFNSYIRETGKPYLNNCVASDPRVLNPDLFHDLPARAGVPMISQGEWIGFLWIGRKSEILESEIRPLTAIADIAANAIRRTTLHEQMTVQLKHLEALRKIDMAINNSQDIETMVKTVVEEAVEELQVDAACIYLLKPEAEELECLARTGFHPDEYQVDVISIHKGLAGQIAKSGSMLTIPDVSRADDLAEIMHKGFQAYFGAPLISKGEIKGVLEVFQRKPFTPDSDWLKFLEILAGQAAIAIDNSTFFRDLQKSNLELAQAYEATIEGWSNALDLRDKETEGHSQRVTAMTLAIAMRLGFSDADLVHINRGALLHDIGKMGVPDRILLKPDKLTEEEWVIMHRHPQYAYDMLSSIEYLRPALDIPYCHHEKWDGSGYPRGLKGEQIPLAARIFAVVDVWDALTSDRPYRPAWSEAQARAYIQENAGRHFDPRVVEAFLEVVNSL